MKATQKLHALGQSIWLDNITRDLLNSGMLRDYLNKFSLTGLTSNPSIFDHAIGNSTAYDEDIQKVIDYSTEANVRTHKPAEFYDNSYMEKLQDFVKSLYPRGVPA